MNDTCDQALFSTLGSEEEVVLMGGDASGTLALGSLATQGAAQGGGSSNGVTVDMNLSAILISAFVGRLFGLRGNALSWYMLMNSVRLRWL